MRRAAACLAVATLLGLAGGVFGTEREARLKLSFLREVPVAKKGEPAPKPAFVYVPSEDQSRDQERFDDVVLKNETFLLAAKFFDAVELRESKARKLDLLKDLKFRAPAKRRSRTPMIAGTSTDRSGCRPASRFLLPVRSGRSRPDSGSRNPFAGPLRTRGGCTETKIG